MSSSIRPRGRAEVFASASLIALSVAVSAPAHAADAMADAGATQLEEVIVQARRVDENLQEVPVSVTAFSGEDLTRQNVQKTQDLAKFTPSLVISPGSSTPSAVVITLRGQVQTDILATLDPSVGTYVDGVYWARAYGLNGDLIDIQSVQVLKGPQGTLFGRNTTGGALLINTHDPDAGDMSAQVTGTYGRFNERMLSGVLNLPVVTDKVAVRFAAQRLLRDGYETNAVGPTSATAIRPGSVAADKAYSGSPNGLKYEDRDRWNFRGKLLVRPTDNLSVVLSGEHFEMDERSPARNIRLALPTYTAANSTYSTSSTGALFTGLLNGGPLPTSPANAAATTALGLSVLNGQAATLGANERMVSNNEVPYAIANTDTFNATATLDTAWGVAKLIASHRNIVTRAGVDLDGSSYPIHFTEGRQDIDQESVELQFAGKAVDDRLDYVVGAFYFREDGFDQSISIVVPALNPSVSHFYGLIDGKSVGAYGQASFKVNDRLSFTGGLRYSKDSKGLESRNNNFNTATGLTTCSLVNPTTAFNAGGEVVGPSVCTFARTDTFDGVSYTAGVEYKINDDVMIYAKTAKGFRSGGQNLRAPSPVFFLPFEPETAYSYEIGLKSEFLDRRVRLNVAAFTSEIKDLQRSTLIAQPGGGGLTATILGNAGKAEINGAEVELQALLFEGFRITATGALTDPKYKEFADLSGDRSFEKFGGVAKEQFSLAADYTTELAGATVNFHVDYAWRSKLPGYFYSPNPLNAAIGDATSSPSQGLLGARVTATFGDNYEVALFGRNLTNDRSYYSNLLVAPVGYVSSVRYEPSTYGVSLTARF